MSIEFWSTALLLRGEMQYDFSKHSAGHAVSLIAPNARQFVECSEKGVCLYDQSPVNSPPGEQACQLRVAESHNTAERFLPCPPASGVDCSGVASTGCRSPLTMRQLTVVDIDAPSCFDWWIGRGTPHLPLSLVIKSDMGRADLPTDRYGGFLVSLSLCGQKARHNIQISGPLTSVQTLRLIDVEMVTADDLLRFPNLERFYVTQRADSAVETRVDLGSLQISDGTNASSPRAHLQHLSIHRCSHVCFPESPMLFPHLRSLSLRGSCLGSAVRFPPEMPPLTHLDLSVQNPELIKQFPHCPNLRILALPNLDLTALRTMLSGSESSKRLEGVICHEESLNLTSLEPPIGALEVLRIHESPQFRSLIFPNCDRLMSLRTLDVSGNPHLTTLDVDVCVGLRQLYCHSCPQLREVVGLAGRQKLNKVRVCSNTQLTSIDVSGCVNLTKLEVHSCKQLSAVVGLTGLGKLEELSACDNPRLTTLDVNGCASLTHVDFQGCQQLSGVVGLTGLEKLEHLSAGYNPQLTTLNVSGCSSLTHIYVQDCQQLSAVVGLAGLGNLEQLHAYNNPQLTTLDVSGCASLTHIYVQDCQQLSAVVGLAGLEKLEQLYAYNNTNLVTLDLSGCFNLTCLSCDNCPSLQRVVGIEGLHKLS